MQHKSSAKGGESPSSAVAGAAIIRQNICIFNMIYIIGVQAIRSLPGPP
jgi:hypothetical protein